MKAIDPVDFLKVVRQYQMLPESPAYYINATAIVLPWLEIVCGLVLVLGAWLRGSAILIAGMLVVFMPAILVRTLGMMKADPTLSFFHVEFDCGCGTGVEIIWIKFLKNTGLLILAAMVLFSRTHLLCLGPWLDRRRERAPVADGIAPAPATSGRTPVEDAGKVDREPPMPFGTPDTAS